MHAKTSLAVAGSVLALPSAALAAAVRHANVTDDGALHPPGKAAQDRRLKQRLVREHVRLARRLDRHGDVRRLHSQPVSVLRKRNHRLRMHVAHQRPATPAPLQAIANCESGGNPATDTGNGFYGKYQFTMGTWQSVGGTGNPARASEAEQDRRAGALYARSGGSSWPVCGR